MGKTLLKICLIVKAILLLIVFAASMLYNRELIVDFIMNLSGYPLEKRDVMDGLITSSRLWILRGGVLSVAIINVFCVLKIDHLYSFICKFFSFVFKAFKNVFSDIKSTNALLLLTIPFVASLYFAATVPVSLDEGFTFVEFTNKPFYYCAIFYPYPNNHVLHSLLTNLTDCLPFFSTLFKLRLPALFSSIFAWMIAFSFLKRHYSKKMATLVVGLSSVAFMAVYYSFMARGYSMVMLFFVIALYASFNIIKYNKRKDWMFFVIASVLGFYVMPSFLYPFVTLNVFILISNIRTFKNQLVFGVVTVFLVVTCYMPIIVVDGLNALVGNNFVLPKSRGEVLGELLYYLRTTLFELFNLPGIIIILLSLSSIILAIKQKDKQVVILWIVFLVMPILLLIGHSVIPFPRTFNYYGFVIPFLIAISFRKYIDKIHVSVLLLVIIIVQLLSVFYFSRNISKYETFNTENKVINDWVFEDASADNTYYIAGGYNVQNFIFELGTHGYNEEVATLNWTDEPISVDSLSSYNYVIVDTHIDSTQVRKPVFSNGKQNVYKNK